MSCCRLLQNVTDPQIEPDVPNQRSDILLPFSFLDFWDYQINWKNLDNLLYLEKQIFLCVKFRIFFIPTAVPPNSKTILFTIKMIGLMLMFFFTGFDD